MLHIVGRLFICISILRLILVLIFWFLPLFFQPSPLTVAAVTNPFSRSLPVRLPPLSLLYSQCVSLLHRSASARTTKAVHVPLLQADAVPGPGQYRPVQTNALERGQTPRWTAADGSRAGWREWGRNGRRHRVVSVDDISSLYFYIFKTVSHPPKCWYTYTGINLLPMSHSVTSCATKIFPMNTEQLVGIAQAPLMITCWGCGPSVSGCRWTLTQTQRTSMTGILIYLFLSHKELVKHQENIPYIK